MIHVYFLSYLLVSQFAANLSTSHHLLFSYLRHLNFIFYWESYSFPKYIYNCSFARFQSILQTAVRLIFLKSKTFHDIPAKSLQWPYISLGATLSREQKALCGLAPTYLLNSLYIFCSCLTCHVLFVILFNFHILLSLFGIGMSLPFPVLSLITPPFFKIFTCFHISLHSPYYQLTDHTVL